MNENIDSSSMNILLSLHIKTLEFLQVQKIFKHTHCKYSDGDL